MYLAAIDEDFIRRLHDRMVVNRHLLTPARDAQPAAPVPDAGR